MKEINAVFELLLRVYQILNSTGAIDRTGKRVLTSLIKQLSHYGDGKPVFGERRKDGHMPVHTEYIDLPLTDTDKKAIMKLDFMKDCIEDLSIATGLGYKLVQKFDPKNKATVAWMYGGEKTPNKGKCLVARANNFLNALKVLHYKHFTLCQADSWKKEPENEIDWLG